MNYLLSGESCSCTKCSTAGTRIISQVKRDVSSLAISNYSIS